MRRIAVRGGQRGVAGAGATFKIPLGKCDWLSSGRTQRMQEEGGVGAGVAGSAQ